jgi:hypothetical protein
MSGLNTTQDEFFRAAAKSPHSNYDQEFMLLSIQAAQLASS